MPASRLAVKCVLPTEREPVHWEARRKRGSDGVARLWLDLIKPVSVPVRPSTKSSSDFNKMLYFVDSNIFSTDLYIIKSLIVKYDTGRQYLNFNKTDFCYSSLFGVAWLSNLRCSTFGKRISPLIQRGTGLPNLWQLSVWCPCCVSRLMARHDAISWCVTWLSCVYRTRWAVWRGRWLVVLWRTTSRDAVRGRCCRPTSYQTVLRCVNTWTSSDSSQPPHDSSLLFPSMVCVLLIPATSLGYL